MRLPTYTVTIKGDVQGVGVTEVSYKRVREGIFVFEVRRLGLT